MKSDLSICIPTYRRPELLERCLHHLFNELARVEIRCQIIISDNNNGKAYDKIWQKYSALLEKFSIIIISSPVTLEAHENWYCALKLVTSDNFILMCDDDYFCDLSLIEVQDLKRKTVLFNTNVIYNDDKKIKKNLRFDLGSYPTFMMLMISFGIIKPTLCATIMNAACLKTLLDQKPKFGPNGDHLDGFLLLSSLKYSEKSNFINKPLTYYSLEGQGYSSQIKIWDHLFITKYRFIKHTYNYLGVRITIIALIWSILGGVHSLIKHVKNKINV